MPWRRICMVAVICSRARSSMVNFFHVVVENPMARTSSSCCPAVIAGEMSVSCHAVASPDWLGTTFAAYPSRLFLEPSSAQPGPVAVIVARRGKENIH